jgi:hypothetical protein
MKTLALAQYLINKYPYACHEKQAGMEIEKLLFELQELRKNRNYWKYRADVLAEKIKELTNV